MSGFALRPYQTAAVERLRELIRRHHKRILLVAATGAGKTVVASHMIVSALARGRRVLFVAHRREILDQTYRKLLAFGVPRESLSIVMGNDPRFRPGAAVQIASIQTLNNRDKPPADLVFFDEAHRAISESYIALDRCYPEAINVGLTASPWRADGKPMSTIYTSLAVVATPAELIADGFLVEPRVWTVPEDQLPDLSAVKRRGGDYDKTQLATAVDRAKLVGDIVDHWQKHAEGRRTVCFAASVEHSQNIVGQFRERGIAAEHLDGNTPDRERDAILKRLEVGQTLVVSNCNVLQEGWDCPPVKCAILARPTLSLALHIQQAGRVLRPWQGQTCVILDHAGNCAKHGMPQEEREYSLEVPMHKAARLGAPPTKTCECFAVLAAATQVCPLCGYVFAQEDDGEGGGRQIEVVAGELVEMKPATVEERRAYFEELCKLAAERGYKVGFVLHRYEARFRTPPPSQWSARKRVAALQRAAVPAASPDCDLCDGKGAHSDADGIVWGCACRTAAA